MAFTSIPVVDLTRWRTGTAADQATFAAELREICHQVGFFSLVGHGVPEEFLTRYFAALEAFFALPDAAKASIDKANSPYFRGWERIGSELTDNRVDYREQLDVSSEWPPVTPTGDAPYLRLYGPNQRLDDALLPGFGALVDEFFGRMRELARELMQVLSVGLGLDPDHLEQVFGERQHSLAKLITYPATPAGECGVNAHHDAGFLTLLLQHGVGGLQARNPDGDWIDVPPRDDAFVVNLGEMLQAMSGNYFVATMHRVIAAEPRFSTAYFHGPDLETPLVPLPLDASFAVAVAASPRHAKAGFMAKRDELLAGDGGVSSAPPSTYGQQLWNYYVRSYPENVRRHHPALVG